VDALHGVQALPKELLTPVEGMQNSQRLACDID
jgi:hypothetical protein